MQCILMTARLIEGQMEVEVNKKVQNFIRVLDLFHLPTSMHSSFIH